ncbi:Berberine bridge enzyme-like 14 [Citrus sinensis]|uniref:Berberine bridge enzyme-like 14 n=1 Tax=Citrus sinensis TaxID=2711 RepID=A0ACB8NCU6_CITSI|nr:Berberine bridge enzyme-like 14 [Citrus sinensis]
MSGTIANAKKEKEQEQEIAGGKQVDAESSSVEENFLQCLSMQSQSSIAISEAIYTSSNASFSSVLQSYVRNLRFATPTTLKPLVIVAAKHESHVQATVICSKKFGLQIRIRSGGHDYDGLSYASKIHGFPAGVCPTLGVGGHFSGGGYGNMMRKFGLSVDNIVDAQIVDVQGRILDRKSMGEDLFWAIRGGGAASFCVILSWKIKLVQVPETVTVFRVVKTLEQGATDLVAKWQQVATDKLDQDLFIRLFINAVNGSKEGEKTVKVSFVAMFLGQTEKLLSLMKQSFPELGIQKKDCFEMRWVESVLFWFDQPIGTPLEVLLNRIPKSQVSLKRKSDYVQEPIPKTGLESIWKLMIELGEVGMQWNPYGGIMSEIPATETPFPHRAGNIFKIQYSANWNQPGIEVTNRYLNLTRTFYEAMTPYVSKNPREAFLNYRDIDIGSNTNGTYEEGKIYGIKYFKNNFDRLVRVKTSVDPDNFFTYEQSIPISPS